MCMYLALLCHLVLKQNMISGRQILVVRSEQWLGHVLLKQSMTNIKELDISNILKNVWCLISPPLPQNEIFNVFNVYTGLKIWKT